MKNAPWILVLALLGFAVVQQVRIGQAQAREVAARVRADSIAAEAVVKEIALDSTWSVLFAENDARLGARLAAGDSAQARLASQLAAANVRIGLLSEVTASATGEILSLSASRGALLDSINVMGEVFGSWEGEVRDDILTGAWRFTLPAATHALTYSVRIPGEIIVSQAGDGRTVVTARSTAPNATLSLGQTFVDPPPPEQVKVLSLTRAVVAALLGAVAWEFAR